MAKYQITAIHLSSSGAIDAYELDHEESYHTHKQILKMMSDGHSFFYTDNNGDETPVEAVIKTKGNKSTSDNLLSLKKIYDQGTITGESIPSVSLPSTCPSRLAFLQGYEICNPVRQLVINKVPSTCHWTSDAHAFALLLGQTA